MRTILLAAVLALGAGCSKSEKTNATATEEAESKVPLATVAEVDRALAAGECTPVDANSEHTRKKMGIVPGAVLLTSSDNISALPADKARPLVFYCANTRCSASDEAAEKAMLAGYQNVKVMREGIAGWVEAGKQVQTL